MGEWVWRLVSSVDRYRVCGINMKAFVILDRQSGWDILYFRNVVELALWDLRP
jgi:hypothetical protein